MKDDPLPLTDHVSRYCSSTFLAADGRPSQTAFYLNGDDCVSVNWLEHFGLSLREEQIDEVRKALTANGLTLRKTGRLAVLNVGDVKSHVLNQTKQQITFSHQPDPPHDLSHSGIFYPLAEQAFIEFLATRVAERVLEVYPGKKSV